ncbi:MAG TPA: hypothetical protein VGK73_34715 [Polyangiaceae bacterium]
MDGRDFSRFALVLALFCAGCTSDETIVCERLDECKLLPVSVDPKKNYTVEQCELDVPAHVSDDRLERCAECVTKESCDTLLDACREHCEPIY